MTAEQIRKLDSESSLSNEILMEQAGTLAADRIAKLFLQSDCDEVFIVVGTGNNGADGLVVARHLHARQIPVRYAMPLGSGKNPLFEKQQHRLNFAPVSTWPGKHALIVDALFGVGLDRPLENVAKSVVSQINRYKNVAALDVPSGLNATTGNIMGAAVQAQWTLSFGYLKPGLFMNDGDDCCGKTELLRLSYLEAPPVGQPWDENLGSDGVFLFQAEDLYRHWPKRSAKSHKGTHGHALCLTGWDFVGAALLSIRGAQATGCGYVHWAQDGNNDLVRKIVKSEPEVLFHSNLLEALEKVAAVAVGSGCSSKTVARELFQILQEIPTVVDAGALEVMAQHSISAGSSWVLTPHPGEAAKLLGCKIDDIEKDRIQSAQSLAEKYQCTVLLKGHRTVVASPGHATIMISSGNEALAKAGTGDVLSGMLVSLLAQKVEPRLAAALASWLHGHVGDVWVQGRESGGLTPSKLIEMVPQVLKECLS